MNQVENTKSAKKYECTLVMSGTKDYAFAIGTLLIGLKKHSPNFFDHIVIYNDSFFDNDKMSMLKIFENITFKKYNLNVFKDTAETENIKRYSKMAFAIYEIFNELYESKKVLYLDGDILIQKDISGIVNYGEVAMRPGGRTLKDALGFDLPGIEGIPCRNSGVVFVSDTIQFEHLTAQCYELTLKYWDKLFLPDQSILNLVLLKNNITIDLFPFEYNNNLNNISYKNYMIHQTTKRKFWSNGIVNLLTPEWEENYKRWLDIGGSKYSGKMSFKEFQEFTNRKVDKFVFIAKVYRQAIELFLKTISLAFVDSYIVEIKNYILYLQLKKYTLLVRFEIRFFGDECRYKFYAEDPNIIENFLENKTFRYVYKKERNRLDVIYIERLTESFLEEKDIFINKINKFITNINSMLLKS